MPTPYDGPAQFPHAVGQLDQLADHLGGAINIILTGRDATVDERVRLVTGLLDLAELAGLRGDAGA